jgi:arginase
VEEAMAAYVCIAVPQFIGELKPERTEIESLKRSGIAEEIGANWVDITPDTSGDPVIAVNRALADTIKAHADKTPLIFAADCVSALGALKGLEAQRPGVLWYDAHGDFNTWETTPSGFLGGMPLAMLTGRGDMQYMRGIDLAPISDEDIVITDARDLDPEEEVALRQSKVSHLPNIDDLLSAPLPDRPMYIHMDVDVLDPAEMPGLMYPALGGPSVEQVNKTVKRVMSERPTAGILFSLWNGSMVTDDRALQSTLRLVRTMAGV